LGACREQREKALSEQSSSTVSHLVIVGSSSGGIEALSELVSALPREFPAPIVVAQHLSPDHESHLEEILSHRSTLPVKTVTDHDTLEPGVVYVVPSNRHVNIAGREVDLRVDSAGRPKPSIDLLLSSAAGVYGERLIAVILSGAGTDGAEGARAVHLAGGTVVVQNPETARFGGMPGSIAPNVVDVSEDIEEIGPTLARLLPGELEVREKAQDGTEREALARFLEDLRDRHGMDFRSYKEPTIMRRLKRKMAVTGHESLEEYARHLEEDPEEYRQLVSAFLIKVTEFFRDPELFEYLREEVLPGLIEEARRSGRQLRIWSAGCATGEEAYSLAMLLTEVLGAEAGLFNVRIFATDVDEDAVNFARQGLYPPSALSPLSDEQIRRFFDHEGGQYVVKKPIRNMIVFGEHDLARRSPFPRIDLAMSRNVLIYFTNELQRRALQLFAYSLRDGGYLVLGKAESVSPLPEFFEPAHRQHKVYRRRGARFLMPLGASFGPAPRPAPRQGRRPAEDGQAPRAVSDLQSNLRERARSLAEEPLLERLPIGVVAIDRRYDILTINNAARRMLSIHGVAVGEDFLHLLQRVVPYAEVRNAIDAAFRDGEQTVTGEFGVEDVTTGEPSYLQLTCYPQRPEGEEGVARTVAIVVSDVTGMARGRREAERELEGVRAEFEAFRREAEARAARLRLQSERLIETNRQLEEANRELTDLVEELQVASEEALLNAEEAQAATEEVETLNEELQATNEELETLNEELQATVEELNTTNDDLQARRNELQDVLRSREEERRAADEERRRLGAILLGIGDPVLAVGSEGQVLFSNEAFTRAFGDGAAGEHPGLDSLGDLIPLDEAGARLPPEASPRARAARGESFGMRLSVRDGGVTRRYEVKGNPIDGVSGGGVIVLREAPASGDS
jgi:two-component system CheB/CheR fusion protein